MGRDEFSCIVLQELYAAKDIWESIHVATNPDEMIRKRGTQCSVSPLKLLGETLKLPVHTIPHTKAEFRHWKPPPLFVTTRPPINHVIVTASFGRILSGSLLEYFSPGRRLNVHPSLLPAYRGPAPIQHALKNGETETGVCVIDMLEFRHGIDSGDIWGCARVPLYDGAMFSEARNILAHVGGRLLVSVLRNMRIGKAGSVPQEPVGKFPQAPAITAEDSLIDFVTMSASDIANRYRAISHQRPLITFLLSGKSLQLHAPEVIDCTSTSLELPVKPGIATLCKPTQTLIIRCAGGSLLNVPLVKQEGRPLVAAAHWWNGVKGLGLVRENELQLLDGKTQG